jgi:dihydroorotase-like cyclic amidohydrolase
MKALDSVLVEIERWEKSYSIKLRGLSPLMLHSYRAHVISLSDFIERSSTRTRQLFKWTDVTNGQRPTI